MFVAAKQWYVVDAWDQTLKASSFSNDVLINRIEIGHIYIAQLIKNLIVGIQYSKFKAKLFHISS